jgi:hypothetical protein
MYVLELGGGSSCLPARTVCGYMHNTAVSPYNYYTLRTNEDEFIFRLARKIGLEAQPCDLYTSAHLQCLGSLATPQDGEPKIGTKGAYSRAAIHTHIASEMRHPFVAMLLCDSGCRVGSFTYSLVNGPHLQL